MCALAQQWKQQSSVAQNNEIYSALPTLRIQVKRLNYCFLDFAWDLLTKRKIASPEFCQSKPAMWLSGLSALIALGSKVPEFVT